MSNYFKMSNYSKNVKLLQNCQNWVVTICTVILFKRIEKWPIPILAQLTKNLYTSPNAKYQVWTFFLMSSYLISALKENNIPPSEFRSSTGILSQTLGKQFPYSSLGLRPRVEYGNSSPLVWERILILLPPSEGGMYYSILLCQHMSTPPSPPKKNKKFFKN